MIPLDRRFYADAPCPACGHYGTRAAPSWCYVQEGERRFWCGRVGTYRGMKGTPGKDGQGFSHWFLTLDEAKAAGQLKPRDAARQHQQPRATPARCDPPPVDAEVFREADRQARKRVTAGQVRELADRLGVTCGSLRRLGIGWIGSAVGMKVDRGTGEERRCRVLPGLNTRCRGDGAYSFPIFTGRWATCGLRLRAWPPSPGHPDGYKYAADGIDGSGLHLPEGLAAAAGGDLLAPEGASGTAALLSLRFAAIGRPNCSAGVGYLREAVARIRPARVFVIGDRDKPDRLGRRAGEESAPVVAGRLRGAWPGLKVCTHLIPPEGVKDSRVWLHDGLDRDELMGAMDQAVEDAAGNQGWRHAG